MLHITQLCCRQRHDYTSFLWTCQLRVGVGLPLLPSWTETGVFGWNATAFLLGQTATRQVTAYE